MEEDISAKLFIRELAHIPASGTRNTKHHVSHTVFILYLGTNQYLNIDRVFAANQLSAIYIDISIALSKPTTDLTLQSASDLSAARPDCQNGITKQS